MNEINFLAIGTAALVAFFASFAWYILFAKQRAKLSPAAATSGRPNPGLMLAELVKNFVLAFAVAFLANHLGVTSIVGAVHLSLLLWIAFPVLILTSSVMYEKVPLKLAIIHAGDWLVKLVVITSIVGLWS